MQTATGNTKSALDAIEATERATILQLLDAWIRQRPGLEFANYGDVASYRSELRSITKDLNDARALLSAIAWRTSIGAKELREAFRAYSGRLSLVTRTDKKGRDCLALEYCTGQYWPTEYRPAACAVLASALWDYFRDNMPAPDGWEVRGPANWDPRGKFTHETAGTFTTIAEANAVAAERGPGWYPQEKFNGKDAGEYLRDTCRREFGRSIARRWFS